MSHKFLEPIKIGNQTVKNRVMFLAMAKNISNFDDSVSAKDIAYVESVAAGGVGLLVPGAMIVDPEWPSVLPLQPGIYDDRFIPGLRRLVLAAHKYDAKILFQLWHPGATNYSGIDPKTVDELTKDEIHAIQDKFVAAAKRAMAAGADGIEFQTCHGYLACQFISPLFNHRTDEYGWNKVEDRTRFATEILTRIRKVIGPDKIISVKMQGFDYPKSEGPNGNDGITPEQAAEVAPYLEKAGADMIAVSAGGTIYHQDDIMSGDVHRAEGWKVPAATMVKNAVSVPVVATGSIRHPDFVDQIINDGKCDMVGMGRGILAEREWVKKCAEGREDELRYCISCMNCFNVNIDNVCVLIPGAHGVAVGGKHGAALYKAAVREGHGASPFQQHAEDLQQHLHPGAYHNMFRRSDHIAPLPHIVCQGAPQVVLSLRLAVSEQPLPLAQGTLNIALP